MMIYIKGKRGEGKTTLLNFIKEAVSENFTTGYSGIIAEGPYTHMEYLEIGNPGRRMCDNNYEADFCPIIKTRCVGPNCMFHCFHVEEDKTQTNKCKLAK